MGEIISGIGIGSVLASVVSGLFSSSSASSSNDLTISENQKNRDFEEYMWNQYNEYNLPVNQVQRYKDAGLNPALMYTSGSTTSTSTSYGTPSTSNQFKQTFSPETAQAISSLFEAAINSELAKAHIAKEMAETANTELDSRNKQVALQFSLDTYADSIENLKFNNQYLASATTRNNSESDMNNIRSQLYSEEIKYTSRQISKIDAEIENLKLDHDMKNELIEYQKKVNRLYTALTQSQIDLNKSQSGYYQAASVNQISQAAKNYAEELLTDLKSDYQKLENAIFSRYGKQSAIYDLGQQYSSILKNLTDAYEIKFGQNTYRNHFSESKGSMKQFFNEFNRK